MTTKVQEIRDEIVRQLRSYLPPPGKLPPFSGEQLVDLLICHARDEVRGEPKPIPLILTCPLCGARHVDRGEFATRVHHTHSCQSCGLTWRPAVVPTVGVQHLPGFKDEE